MCGPDWRRGAGATVLTVPSVLSGIRRLLGPLGSAPTCGLSPALSSHCGSGCCHSPALLGRPAVICPYADLELGPRGASPVGAQGWGAVGCPAGQSEGELTQVTSSSWPGVRGPCRGLRLLLCCPLSLSVLYGYNWTYPEGCGGSGRDVPNRTVADHLCVLPKSER